MLVNVKAIKTKIKEAGLKSNPEVIVGIDRKVNGMIDSIIAVAKEKKVKKLTVEDIL